MPDCGLFPAGAIYGCPRGSAIRCPRGVLYMGAQAGDAIYGCLSLRCYVWVPKLAVLYKDAQDGGAINGCPSWRCFEWVATRGCYLWGVHAGMLYMDAQAGGAINGCPRGVEVGRFPFCLTLVLMRSW
eukprot:scaffold23446_cov157-Isochrysis_galbana.AAC.1